MENAIDRELREYAGTLEAELRKSAMGTHARISTLAVVGNAAALLLCFNAVISGQLSIWPSIQPAAVSLAVGLILAGAAFLGIHLGTVWTSTHVTAANSLWRQIALAHENNEALEKIRDTVPERKLPVAEKSIAENDAKIKQLTTEFGALQATPKKIVVVEIVTGGFLLLSFVSLAGAILYSVLGIDYAAMRCP